MLFLIVEISNHLYAIESTHVSRIVSLVDLKKIPNMPNIVAGVMNYMENPVPVIDLRMVIEQKPTEKIYLTRLIIFDYGSKDETKVQIAIMAENINQVMNYNESDFIDSGIHLKEVPFLGGFKTDQDQVIQMISTEKLLAYVKKYLYEDIIKL